MKTKVENVDLDKFKTVPADLSNVSLIENDVVKKMYYILVTKVNAVDTKMPSTSGLITKAHYDLYKHGFEESIEDVHKKIPGVTLEIEGSIRHRKDKKGTFSC